MRANRHSIFLMAAGAVLLAGCQQKPRGDERAPDNVVQTNAAPSTGPAAAPSPAPSAPVGDWQASASGEGDMLRLADSGGGAQILLFCPAASGKLLVNVSGFKPVESEERMTFGSDSIVTTLVAGSTGDRQRGGVTGEAAIPRELGQILGSQTGISVNYGNQDAGPFPVIPGEMAAMFEEACYD